MELGALICKPKKPLCLQCPLTKNCKSFKNNDFEIIKKDQKKIDKFYIVNVYKKKINFYLLRILNLCISFIVLNSYK